MQGHITCRTCHTLGPHCKQVATVKRRLPIERIPDVGETPPGLGSDGQTSRTAETTVVIADDHNFLPITSEKLRRQLEAHFPEEDDIPVSQTRSVEMNMQEVMTTTTPARRRLFGRDQAKTFIGSWPCGACLKFNPDAQIKCDGILCVGMNPNAARYEAFELWA